MHMKRRWMTFNFHDTYLMSIKWMQTIVYVILLNIPELELCSTVARGASPPADLAILLHNVVFHPEN